MNNLNKITKENENKKFYKSDFKNSENKNKDISNNILLEKDRNKK